MLSLIIQFFLLVIELTFFFNKSKDFDNYSSEVFAPLSKTELETYLDEKKLPRVDDMDVLNYWSTDQF